MEQDSNKALLQEVEALRAIYGEDKIGFNHATPSSQATVSMCLDGLTSSAPSGLTLTTRLPSSYPMSHPKKPILRSSCFTASQCNDFVDDMMRMQNASEAEVCLYDWFQAMITVINDYEDAANHEVSNTVGQHKLETKKFGIYHGEPLTDRKSVFQAHAASVSCVSDIDLVLATLCRENKKVESATHNTLAYRIMGKNGILHDVDDDGEKGAGKVVLHMLQRFKVVNVVVIVSRWFGGIKLGAVRFRHIAKIAGDVLKAVEGDLCHDGMPHEDTAIT